MHFFSCYFGTFTPCRYNNRIYSLLHGFCARFSDINAIRQETVAAVRLAVHPKVTCYKLWNRFTSESTKALKFMSSMDENQIIDVTSAALGGVLEAHRKFKERHQLHDPIPAEVQLHSKPDDRQLNDVDVAAAQQIRALNAEPADITCDHTSPLATATTITDLMKSGNESRSRIRSVAHNEQKSVKYLQETVTASTSRVIHHAKNVELEEIVVSLSDPPQQKSSSASGRQRDIKESTAQRDPAHLVGASRASHADMWKTLVNQEINAHILNTANAFSSVDPMRNAGDKSHKMHLSRRHPGGHTKSKDRENPPSGATFSSENGNLPPG
jgi:hypothetical protein